jgi:hypothetical protein
VATVTGYTAEAVDAFLAVKADLDTGKLADSQVPTTLVRRGELVLSVKDYGALGDGSTDDSAEIQAALADADPGFTVYLPPGVYVTSSPLIIPPQVRLLGSHGGHIDDVTGSLIKPSSSFTGDAIILMVDQATGSYAGPSIEQRIENLTIDGINITGSTTDGILALGYVHGVYITDVQVRHIPDRGVGTTSNGSGSAYSWHVSRLHVSSTGGIGINAAITDSTWMDCEVIGATGHGWFVGGAGNSAFIGCRSEWSSLDGFNVGSGTGTGSGSGGPTFVGCTTDRNGQNGVSIPSGANGNAPLTFVGCYFRRDGRNSTSAGWAAVNVNGSTQPIVLSGCVVYPGTADDGSGNASPQYGLSATTANVQVNGGVWHAISEGIHDGGSNVRLARGPNIIERTGPTSAPVEVVRGIQSYGTNGDSLHVPGHLAGIPHPEENGLIAWTFPPENTASGKAGIAGTLYLAKIHVPRSVSATKIGWGINTAGVTPTSGQNWIGLYNSAGTLVASVGVDARVTTTGAWLETISSTALTPGFYWVAFLFNAATMPQIYRGQDLNGTLMNLGLTTSILRWATNGTGLTTLPSTITPASNTSNQFCYFAAVAP